jgi:hypothetical protein
MRVHQLAKEYDKKSTDFVKEIQGYGINVFSHLSGLSDDEVATIRQKIETKEVVIKLENELLERSIGVKEPLEDRDDEIVETDDWDPDKNTGRHGLDNIEPSLYDVVKEDTEVKPVEDSELSFGQKAFAKAKVEETKVEEQTVIVEKPRSFWGWLKSLFS